MFNRLGRTTTVRRCTTSVNKSARAVRGDFLDYFTRELDHKYVPSSPVVPINDPTVPFVNAGMNQFKGIFLGDRETSSVRVANSQKCIRVGGKHNDLEAVGLDGYHHTFFEMLGNWSFGDYFKAEACEYAWNLLTGPYGMNKEHLYVTYFGGDEKLGLEPDLECREIWRRLGVAEDRLSAFGMRENFWEMGASGPCGPCTEIHIDRTRSAENRRSLVNGGHDDLTELWNLVFIEYQRDNQGRLSTLEKRHVDTGMGLERLVAVIQGKSSNYDTDLFSPIFEAIRRLSGSPGYQGQFQGPNTLDTNYRILADHSRMISVALADGMVPEQNYKLRRVIRKALTLSRDYFRRGDLLRELTYHVAETLGDVYPELRKNLPQIRTMIEYEEQVSESLRNSTGAAWQELVKNRPALAEAITDPTPAGLIPAYKELQNILGDLRTSGGLNGDFAFKLYDTYGLGKETIAELAALESLSFNEQDFNESLDNAKLRSKIATGQVREAFVDRVRLLESNGIPKTDDALKYRYEFKDNAYEFPAVEARLLGLLVNGKFVSSYGENEAVFQGTNDELGIVLDKTCLYSPEGGQSSDKAGLVRMVASGLSFEVEKVVKMRGYVIHWGRFLDHDKCRSIAAGDDCLVTIEAADRIGLMRNHTATHLMNAALRKVLPIICQCGSLVTSQYLTFEFNTFGHQIDKEMIAKFEKLVNDCIAKDAPVGTRIVDMAGLLAEEDLTLIPGEVYPETEIRLVEVETTDLGSKEACCGTHVHRTGLLEDFCVLNAKGSTRVQTIRAVAGPLARQAKIAGLRAKEHIANIEADLHNAQNLQSNDVLKSIDDMRKRLADCSQPTAHLDVLECLDRLNEMTRILRIRENENVRKVMETEMKAIIRDNAMPFVVHCFAPTNTRLEHISLERVTSLCSSSPVFVIVLSTSGKVKARCCVPKEMVTSDFNAESWMKMVLPIFKGSIDSRAHNPVLVSHMSIKRIQKKKLTELVERAIDEATKFAAAHLLNDENSIKNR